MSDPSSPRVAGSAAPDFTLIDVLSGQPVTFSHVLGQGAVLDFWSVDCPWSRYYDDYFIERAAQWAAQGITLVMIGSNLSESIQEMRDMADAFGLHGPILRDENCRVADLYGAQTTPHLFVINAGRKIIYQGAVDDRSFRRQQPTVNYLDAAVAALRGGKQLVHTDTPAYGCALMRFE